MKREILDITARLAARSARSRAAYLEGLSRRPGGVPRRRGMSCGNLAHVSAACAKAEKQALEQGGEPNIAIVTAYNDMLSAHQPYREVPEILKAALRRHAATGQVAGGVPAMCDGITQGRGGMELSLFSRDLIAMSTAVALSHEAFDGVMLLGICDKIVPGLLIGALRFGHLPAVFVPSGPMPSGIPNHEKAKVREAHAAGRAGRTELLAAETASYHAPGTCTFYGTANSNQLLLEAMGLQLPGSSFVPPGTALRSALHAEAAARMAQMAREDDPARSLGALVDERAIVNAVVVLLATGGSTNHTLHLPAIAAAAGIRLQWSDIEALSRIVPLLARMYPNGSGDVNHFHAAGGMAFLVAELLDAGLLHEGLPTVAGRGMCAYREAPREHGDRVTYAPVGRTSGDREVLRGVRDAFSPDGGLRVLGGNLGEAVIKVSAVNPEHRRVEAQARVFGSQDEFQRAFIAGELERDVVVVLPHQGPRANGMPELHGLTPMLSVLQDRGHRVALVTDGRMSGASGKVPSAIHVTPEAATGGPIARIRDGDIVLIDTERGELSVKIEDAVMTLRPPSETPQRESDCGQELFGLFRAGVGPATSGACVFDFPGNAP